MQSVADIGLLTTRWWCVSTCEELLLRFVARRIRAYGLSEFGFWEIGFQQWPPLLSIFVVLQAWRRAGLSGTIRIGLLIKEYFYKITGL